RPEKVREVCGASAKHRQTCCAFDEVERLAQKSAPAAQRRAAQEHGEGLARQRYRSKGQGNPELREAAGKQAEPRYPHEVERQATPVKPVVNQDVRCRARHSRVRSQKTEVRS